MAKISELPELANPTGTETVVVLSDGNAKRVPLAEAAAAAMVAGGATIPVADIAAREAIPLEARRYGLTVFVVAENREFRWTQDAYPENEENPEGPRIDGWVGRKTDSEWQNGIDAADKALNQALIVTQEALAANAKLKVPALSAIAIADRTEVSWQVDGTGLLQQTVSWAEWRVPLPPSDRRFSPPDWATPKRIAVAGNSLSDTTGLSTRWSQLFAAAQGVELFSVAKFSSDTRQVYRTGAAQIYLTLEDNVLPAAGIAGSVTHINGAEPNADGFISPQSFLNEAPGTSAVANVSMTGRIVSGGLSRRVTVSIPNSGSIDYVVEQDAGLTELPLDGPVLFVPDAAEIFASSDVIIAMGNNNFYTGIPGEYPGFEEPQYLNPQLWIDLDLIVRLARGNRILMLPILPNALWETTGLGNPYAAMEAANAYTEMLYPHFIARDAMGRTLLERLQDHGDGSANDNADIAAGFVPRSLRLPGDPVHMNVVGDEIIAAFVEEAWSAQVLPPPLNIGDDVTLSVAGQNGMGGPTWDARVTRVAVDGVASELSKRTEAYIQDSEPDTTAPALWFDTSGGFLTLKIQTGA